MNKTEFIEAVAGAMSVSKTKAADAVSAVLSTIQKALENGDEIRIVGFGAFKVADVRAKVVRNPQNGQKINVPACKRPKFIPGKDLKEAVNRK
ncbi:MAG: HU family DNA-binding protein [Candidatus Lariskella arthropodorum]|uniref:HU family DNA-binding protein n=1 Tax=Candidatus Lariskella endosymbiont of Epinotia ramella TaxID=3066224 RepID=UPI0030CBE47B